MALVNSNYSAEIATIKNFKDLIFDRLEVTDGELKIVIERLVLVTLCNIDMSRGIL